MDMNISQLTVALIAVERELHRRGDELRHHHPCDADMWAPALDRVLRDSVEVLEAARRFLVLHRTPEYTAYDPLERFRAQSPHVVRTHDSLAPDEPLLFHGDPEQITECLRLALRGFDAVRRDSVTTRFYLDDDDSRIDIAFDDNASPPDTFPLADALVLDGPILARCWAAATQGGTLERTEHVIQLYLVGDGPVPPADTRADAALPILRSAAARLMPWRGAIGHFEPGFADDTELVALYAAPVQTTAQLLTQALAVLQSATRSPQSEI